MRKVMLMLLLASVATPGLAQRMDRDDGGRGAERVDRAERMDRAERRQEAAPQEQQREAPAPPAAPVFERQAPPQVVDRRSAPQVENGGGGWQGRGQRGGWNGGNAGNAGQPVDPAAVGRWRDRREQAIGGGEQSPAPQRPTRWGDHVRTPEAGGWTAPVGAGVAVAPNAVPNGGTIDHRWDDRRDGRNPGGLREGSVGDPRRDGRRDGGWNGRDDRRTNGWNGRDDRRWNGHDRDNRRWTNHWHNDRRYDWRSYRNQNRFVFRLGTYRDPFGYGYRPLSIGYTMYSGYYQSNYWLDDPYEYRLPPVYGPYRWVRYYDDAVLVDIYSGRVVEVIRNFFW